MSHSMAQDEGLLPSKFKPHNAYTKYYDQYYSASIVSLETMAWLRVLRLRIEKASRYYRG
jgi:hypothetical protein